MLYPTWIFNAHMNSMRVDFEIFSPALCRPTQGWRQTMDYIGVKTARISHWLANKCFFLFWSWRRECPVFFAVLLESKFLVTGGECSELCISSFSTFLLGVKLPVEEDKSIDFTAELIDDASSPFPKLESSCSGCQGVLNPPSPLSCLRTLCCWLGQKLLATLVGFPMLGKSPYCLQTSNMLLALLEKRERKRGGEVENSTCHSRLSCRAGSKEKK